MTATFNRRIHGLVPFMVLAFLTILTIGAPSVFADGGQSTGIDAILRSSSLEGDASFRQTIAGYLNRPIAFVITIAGFLVITFSFLKFVLTLLYLSFPDIFDKIDAHQKSALSVGFKDSSPIDMISYVFALFIPNVKSLTDYAQEDHNLNTTVMDYIKKKLPSIVGYIILGAMIYDGQARNFIAKAADVGVFLGSIVEDHDTVAMVAGFVDSGERYIFAYDKGTQAGKNDLKIANTLQKTIHGLNQGLKDEKHAGAVGAFVEEQVKLIRDEIEVAAGKGGIGSYDKIVSFNISARTQATAGTSWSDSGTTAEGSGVFRVTLPADVLDVSKKQYMTVTYSQIVDKNNRNALFKATDGDTEQ